MAIFPYRVPEHGRQVQGWIADDPTGYDRDDDADTYQSLACLACASVHMVIPRPGRCLEVPIRTMRVSLNTPARQSDSFAMFTVDAPRLSDCTRYLRYQAGKFSSPVADCT